MSTHRRLCGRLRGAFAWPRRPVTEPPNPRGASETTPPASSEPSAESAPEQKVTIAIDVAGEARRVRVMVDGVRKCAIPLEKGDVPTVGNGQVTISNGNTVKTVDLDNCPNED